MGWMKKIATGTGALLCAAVLVWTPASFGGTAAEARACPGALYEEIDYSGMEKVTETPNFDMNPDVQQSNNQFQPSGFVSDHMVLQRNAVTCVWGDAMFTGPCAAEINGRVWYGEAKDGKFEIYLAPMEAGGPYHLTLYSKNAKKVVEDVMIGEVILASGQSNMTWQINDTTVNFGKQFLNWGTYRPTPAADPDTYHQTVSTDATMRQYVQTVRDEIASETKATDRIRICDLRQSTHPDDGFNAQYLAACTTPRDTVPCAWTAATEAVIAQTSMVAYYFAENLRQQTCLPVGVVIAARGATTLNRWVPREVSEANADAFRYEGEVIVPANTCYNAYIAPMRKLKVKAVLWYQGEDQPDAYARGLELMIRSWRDTFELGAETPFVLVGLPRFGREEQYRTGTAADYAAGPRDVGTLSPSYYGVRAAQRQVAKSIANCVVSVNVDQGDYDDIHPFDKRVIAARAADCFREYVYGADGVLSGPVASDGSRAEDGSVTVRFTHTGGGLVVRNGGINFEVSADGVHYTEARATLAGDDAVRIAKPDGLETIHYVRYGMLNYPRLSRIDMSRSVSLCNAEGYPADQFLLDII